MASKSGIFTSHLEKSHINLYFAHIFLIQLKLEENEVLVYNQIGAETYA